MEPRIINLRAERDEEPFADEGTAIPERTPTYDGIESWADCPVCERRGMRVRLGGTPQAPTVAHISSDCRCRMSLLVDRRGYENAVITRALSSYREWCRQRREDGLDYMERVS